MIWIRISLVIATFWGLVQTHSVAVAQTASKEKVKQCANQIGERSAALTAKDWPKLERLAKRYLQDCKGVFNSEDESLAYLDLATANIQLNNAKAALAASDECINIFYRNAGCHGVKVEALIYLGRIAEARTEFEITERLIAYLIEQNERDLRKAYDPSEKSLYSSKDNFLRSQQKFLDSIRYKLYK